MTEETLFIKNPDGSELAVLLRRDKRLRKSARWEKRPDGSILLRIPQRMSRRFIPDLLTDIEHQLTKQKRRAKRRTDADLQSLASAINTKYFSGQITWNAIRWVGNMNHRLGSCTNGGPTDGHIRISDKIRGWPQWVVEYVIAHELAHRIHPDHSSDFWEFLSQAYPLTDQARGFIKGFAFAQGDPQITEDEGESPPE